MIRKYLILLLLVVMLPSLASAGWKLKGQEFPKSHNLVEEKLDLQGVGVKTLFMMRVFIAGFYLNKPMTDKEALGDVPKHLSVKFYAGFSSSQFVNYTINRMKVNLSKAEFKAVSDRFLLLKEYFPNISKGDEMSLSYVPGRGTIIALNGVERGAIPGVDFGKAVFATWIGPRPFDHIVKSQILGLNKG